MLSVAESRGRVGAGAGRQASESTLHSKLAVSDASEEKWNVGVESEIVPDGPESMLVSGAVWSAGTLVSTVKVEVAGLSSVFQT